MRLTTYQRRKLKTAGWVMFSQGLFWQDPASGNYFAPVKAWVMMRGRA
jgi:hypothetical protein